MRNLFIIGMLGVAAFMAGWFTINRDGDNTSIEFNRAEIRNDTRRAIEKGREVLDRHQNSTDYVDQSTQGYPPASAPTAAYGDRNFGQPASYAQPSYPPPSYGGSYAPPTPTYSGQPTPSAGQPWSSGSSQYSSQPQYNGQSQYPTSSQPYPGQPMPTPGQVAPYQGQSAQYPPQPQSAFPRR